MFVYCFYFQFEEQYIETREDLEKLMNGEFKHLNASKHSVQTTDIANVWVAPGNERKVSIR